MKCVIPFYQDWANPWYADVLKLPPGSAVIFSPNSGPEPWDGDLPRAQAHAAELKSRGFLVLGYVKTGRATRGMSAFTADIDHYVSDYGIRDLFLDEFPSEWDIGDNGEVDSFPVAKTYTDAARAHGATGKLWGNVGWVEAPDSWLALLDTVVTYEDTETRYTGLHLTSDLPVKAAPWIKNRTGRPDQQAHIVFGITPGHEAALVAQAQSEQAGWLFLSSLTDSSTPHMFKAKDAATWDAYVGAVTATEPAAAGPTPRGAMGLELGLGIG